MVVDMYSDIPTGMYRVNAREIMIPCSTLRKPEARPGVSF
jgi:hypothetical protein